MGIFLTEVLNVVAAAVSIQKAKWRRIAASRCYVFVRMELWNRGVLFAV